MVYIFTSTNIYLGLLENFDVTELRVIGAIRVFTSQMNL
jgi:hypothetical protein